MTAVARYLADGTPRLGVLTDSAVLDAGPAPDDGFFPTPQAWQDISVGEVAIPLDEVRLMPPLEPAELICIGLNYREHVLESGAGVPVEPLVFAKLRSSVIGPGEAIVIPSQEDQTDWEAELAIVIGTEARNVSMADALDFVGGYTALNDVSGRRAQFGDGQWVRGKSFDTFAPLGPAIRSNPADGFANVPVRCWVSGDLVQDGSSSDLVFGVAELVAYLSHQFTLRPGTVIATGTPSGVGFGLDPPRYLRDGDVVDVAIGELPVLRNPVRASGS